MSNRELWWLNPIKIYLLLVSIIVTYAYITPESSYRMLYDIARKNVDESMMLLYATNSFFFAFGGLVAKNRKHVYVKPRENEMQYIIRIYVILYILSMLAYLVWYINFTKNFGLSAFGTIFNGKLNDYTSVFRERSGRVSGLTTMTQIGVVVAPLGMWLYRKTDQSKFLIQIFILFFLAVIRGFLFSERLAFIELFVPMFVVWFSFKKKKRIYSFIPILGFISLFFIFGFFEYFRSWSSYYQYHYNGTFYQFAFERLIGYYTTAINTESALIQHTDPPYYPYNIFNWFTKIPMIGKYWVYAANGWYYDLLYRYGSPEFNNQGGLLVGLLDFGMFGMIFTFLFGYLFVKIYYRYKEGALDGLILYSICFLAILEFTRIPYFSSHREFYVVISMIVVWSRLKKYTAF